MASGRFSAAPDVLVTNSALVPGVAVSSVVLLLVDPTLQT